MYLKILDLNPNHKIVSRWLQSTASDEGQPEPVQRQAAEKDLFDVLDCNVFIHFADQFSDRPGRGKFIEFGAAHCMNKRIIVVGEPNSIFYCLKNVVRVKTFDDCLYTLQRLEMGM